MQQMQQVQQVQMQVQQAMAAAQAVPTVTLAATRWPQVRAKALRGAAATLIACAREAQLRAAFAQWLFAALIN